MDIRGRSLKLAFGAAGLLPLKAGYVLAGWSGTVISLWPSRQRDTVTANIKHVLGPQQSEKQIKAVTRRVFRNVMKNYFDLMKMPRLNSRNLNKLIEWQGWQYLEKSIAAGKGTIIATAHLGNFEVAAKALAVRGIEMTILVEPTGTKAFMKNVNALRQRNGCKLLPVTAGAMREALHLLQKGGTLVIVCERDIQGNGIETGFFGEKTTVPSGVISLALRTGAAVLPAFSVRRPDNRFTIHFEPPLQITDTGDREQDIPVNLEKLVGVIEQFIRKYPEQWVVMEPIWRESD